MPYPLSCSYPFVGVINGNGFISIYIYKEITKIPDDTKKCNLSQFVQVGKAIGSLECPSDGADVNFGMTFEQSFEDSVEYDLYTREATKVSKPGALGQYFYMTTGACGLSNHIPVPVLLEPTTHIASSVLDYSTFAQFKVNCSSDDE